MRIVLCALLAAVVLPPLALAADSVSPAQTKAWLQHVIRLPQESGPSSSDKPVERRGCNGSITLWKVRQPGEEIKPLPLLPMSQSEKARYGRPR